MRLVVVASISREAPHRASVVDELCVCAPAGVVDVLTHEGLQKVEKENMTCKICFRVPFIWAH